MGGWIRPRRRRRCQRLIEDAARGRNYWVHADRRLVRPGPPVENVNDALRNIPAGARRTELEQLMDDDAARRLHGRWNQAQAAAVQPATFPKRYSRMVDLRGIDPRQRSAYVRLQSLGIPGSALGMYGRARRELR